MVSGGGVVLAKDDVPVRIRWAEEEWALLPCGALHRLRTNTLLVADPHLGKAACFRAAGIPVPQTTTDDTLARLTAALERSGAPRLVVLGDLLHAAQSRAHDTTASFARWRDRHAKVPVLLIRGNHDLRAGDPPAEWRVECVPSGYTDTGVRLCHEPPVELDHLPAGPVTQPTLCGHLHPAVLLPASARRHVRVGCFLFRGMLGLLPAFGRFTGMHALSPRPGDRIFALAQDEVVAIDLATASGV